MGWDESENDEGGKERERARERGEKEKREMQTETWHCIADVGWVTNGRRVKVNG